MNLYCPSVWIMPGRCPCRIESRVCKSAKVVSAERNGYAYFYHATTCIFLHMWKEFTSDPVNSLLNVNRNVMAFSLHQLQQNINHNEGTFEWWHHIKFEQHINEGTRIACWQARSSSFKYHAKDLSISLDSVQGTTWWCTVCKQPTHVCLTIVTWQRVHASHCFSLLSLSLPLSLSLSLSLSIYIYFGDLPVRPIPAEQCTTTSPSVGVEALISPICLLTIIKKSSTESGFRGTPWSGQALKWYWKISRGASPDPSFSNVILRKKKSRSSRSKSVPECGVSV